MTAHKSWTINCDAVGLERDSLCHGWIMEDGGVDTGLRSAVEDAAKRAGWTRQGPRHFCPACFPKVSQHDTEAPSPDNFDPEARA